jgi:hypothetical protein
VHFQMIRVYFCFFKPSLETKLLVLTSVYFRAYPTNPLECLGTCPSVTIGSTPNKIAICWQLDGATEQHGQHMGNEGGRPPLMSHGSPVVGHIGIVRGRPGEENIVKSKGPIDDEEGATEYYLREKVI